MSSFRMRKNFNLIIKLNPFGLVGGKLGHPNDRLVSLKEPVLSTPMINKTRCLSFGTAEDVRLGSPRVRWKAALDVYSGERSTEIQFNNKPDVGTCGLHYIILAFGVSCFCYFWNEGDMVATIYIYIYIYTHTYKDMCIHIYIPGHPWDEKGLQKQKGVGVLVCIHE